MARMCEPFLCTKKQNQIRKRCCTLPALVIYLACYAQNISKNG
jgi:hypothetical protein